MKKISKLFYGIIIGCLFFLVGCQTDEIQSVDSTHESSFVPANEALEIAGEFLTKNSDVAKVKTRAGGLPELKIVYTDAISGTRSDANQQPTYYVINYGDEGYVLVSASKGTYPVLGYSTEGKFDPDEIRFEHERIVERICQGNKIC